MKHSFFKKISLISLIIITASCQPRWSYKGNGAPEFWGSINEKFKFCKIGYNQSPINIKSDSFAKHNLVFSYRNSLAEKKRENYTINILFDDKNFLLRGKKKYNLRKIEFHHPSEHKIDGQENSLEMQVFFKSEDEQWLALAVFLEAGKHNVQFDDLADFISQKNNETLLKPTQFIPQDDNAFFYEGSFTTPPCKEGVKWYVMQHSIQISKEQMNKIIKNSILSKTNARPTQEFHPEKY